MTQEQLTELLTLSENIQEQISIAAELWGMSDFEENALCGICLLFTSDAADE